MNPVEAATLSAMTNHEYTYEPVDDGYIPPLEAGWWEDQPTRINWWQDPRDIDQRVND